MSPLDSHLGAYFRDAAHGRHPHPYAHALRHAIAKDPDLRAAAEARMMELTELDDRCGGQLVRRCIISHHHLACLRIALSQQGAEP